MFTTPWKFGIQLLSLSYFSFTANAVPASCLTTSSTLLTLVSCFDTYTVPASFYTATTYGTAQPTTTQRTNWRTLIQNLLGVDNGNCASVSIPSSLQSIYTVASFQTYCVLYEITSTGGIYDKGWGFMVVPSSRSQVSRHVHISAPHPRFDSGTVEQAAAIFQTSGLNSLLVAGRIRTAYFEPSTCVPPSSPTDFYYMTDPAHNNLEPFFDASVVIHDWQQALDGCPSASCAFIQMHGKAATTCATDTVFLSSGLGNSSSSKEWYRNSVDRPVKRVKTNVKNSFSSWTVSLPSDSNCSLTATTNVFGRFLNNVNIANVCTVGATASTATGQFVHIEQSSDARSAANYAAWSQAVSNSFAAAAFVPQG